MDSGERFKAFTIHTVTCRFAVTVVGFVEGQPQILAKEHREVVTIKCTFNTGCNKSVTGYYVR